MRYVVLGAGGIGGVIGGRVADAGHDVTLVARGPHLEALRAHGLTVESPDDTITPDVDVAGHPEEITWTGQEVVLLCVKSQDTIAAVTGLADHAPPSVVVFCVQNGVANEPTVLRWFPRVYGVCVMCPTLHLTPGVVQACS